MCIRYFSRILTGIFLLGLLSACDIAQTLTITPTIPAITTNFPQATIHRTPTPTATATKESPPLIPTPSQQPTASPEPYLLPLTAYGPNFIGKRIYNFVDESRDNRQVGITVWYPAIKPEGFVGTSLVDAEPDQTGELRSSL